MLERLVHRHDRITFDLQHVISADTRTDTNSATWLESGSWSFLGSDFPPFTRMCNDIYLHGAQAEGDCNLLGRVGIVVQVAITVVCAVVFLSVWLCEKPRRPFLTWLFDISKQVVGAAYGKMYNIAQSLIFSSMLSISPAHQDQCTWYLMSVTMDCFFLTFLLWGANDFMRPILLEHFAIDIGDYDEPLERTPVTDDVEQSKHDREDCCPAAQVRAWCVQMCIWLGIITFVRLCLSVLLFFIQRQVYEFHAGIFNNLGIEDRHHKLVFAVLVYPMFADTFQIVVQDRFLKKQQ